MKKALQKSLFQKQNRYLFCSLASESSIDLSLRLMSYVQREDIGSLQKELEGGTDLNSRDYDQRTPFHFAATFGHYEVVKFFLQNNIKQKHDRFGATPITDAIRNQQYAIQELFQEFQYSEQKTLAVVEKSGRQIQMSIIFNLLIQENIFNYILVSKSLDYYFNELGLDPYYFKIHSADQIAKHISMYISAQNRAEISKDTENLKISVQTSYQQFYICTDMNKKQVENDIENYISKIGVQDSISVIQFKSEKPAIVNGSQNLNIYVVSLQQYENPHLIETDNLYLAANKEFIQKRDHIVLEKYEKILRNTYKKPNSQIEVFQDHKGHDVFMIGVNQGRVLDAKSGHQTFQIQLTQMFAEMNIGVKKRFIETFSNGVVIYNIYTNQNCSQQQINDIVQLSNVLFNIPDTLFRQKLINKEINGNQAIYFQTCINFAFYFLNNKIEEYESLYKYLEKDTANLNKLINLKQSLVKETVYFDKLYEIVNKHQDICLKLYQNFLDHLNKLHPTYENIQTLLHGIEDQLERNILITINTFNQSIVKTNFFNPNKSATSFRLDPNVFLKELQLPEIPFGMYLIIGRDFTGMHIRFRDISRGGVRIIKSNRQNYDQNRIQQFNETYGLAYTQKKKNKDIPESGSKGTILMGMDKNHMLKQAFMQYVDAMSDIMLNVPGTIDLNGHPELIFLGPDENSADLMDPACYFMKKKGYKLWKSFTTGKSPQIGGIPHDVYGMTTRSVRSYVKGIQQKLGLKEKDCTKFMTGGPDGDLGSNEILMGNEKIIGVVDGSGVLFDPEGLDKDSLDQLAKYRRMVSNFSGTLSPKGYLVLLSDENRILPSGELVESGIVFRNNFHLHPDVTGDFFVPCGGRPESVNLQNVDKMFKKDGTPRFKYIVEGANLFFSEGARKKLEDAGVILFKDSSTNKGGVTSSSFEVQAALSLTDLEFMKLMTIQGDEIPEFYQNYVKEICQKLEERARMEFEYIWNEHQKTQLNNCMISDRLSGDMNDLCDIIQGTNLFENEAIKINVMKEIIPLSLQKLVGMNELLKRIPTNYQKAMFSKFIGAKYYYTGGSNQNLFQFYSFMKQYS